MSSWMRKSGNGISNVVGGVLLAIVTAGALTVVVWWGRTHVSGIPSKTAAGVAVAPYLIGDDLVLVNYGYESYVAKILSEDGSVCGDPPATQLPPRSTTVVTTSCSVGWVEVGGSLLTVVRVARRQA